ncbi:MAG: FecR domain-containing protein [Anaerolineales bacterium]|nr:FecR domain-containing protein [Anaerolineales bacterium]
MEISTRSPLPLLLAAILLTACAGNPAAAKPLVTASPNATLPPPTVTATPTPTADEIPLYALLNELNGEVATKTAGAAAFSPAFNGESLSLNGELQTGDDGSARLDFSNGTVVRVARNSHLTLEKNEETPQGLFSTLDLLFGQVFILLAGGSLDVNTPSGLASVRGSYMMVEFDPETSTTTVGCFEGSCRAVSSDGSVDLLAGQKALIVPNEYGLLPIITLLTEEELQFWLELNPDLFNLLPDISATLTALPPFPTPDSRLLDLLSEQDDPILPHPDDPMLPRPDDPMLPRPDDPILPDLDTPILPRR